MLDEVHFSRTLQNFHVFGISKTHEYKFFLCYTLHSWSSRTVSKSLSLLIFGAKGLVLV